MSTEPELTIALETSDTHRIGFPLPVAVLLTNPSSVRTYFSLPPIQRFVVPPPVQFVLTAADQTSVRLPAANPAAREGPSRGIRLEPGQSHRVLVDLSELEPPTEPGAYQLSARYLMRPFSPESAALPITLVQPPPPEAEAADRLRRTNALERRSWNAVLTANFREIEAEELQGLTVQGRASLALHLLVHRAIYSVLPIEDLDPDLVEAAGRGQGPLEAEAAVLRHEILVLRQDASASVLAREIETRWPGLGWRVDRNRDGRGMLTKLRSTYGAERASPPLPAVLPYPEIERP